MSSRLSLRKRQYEPAAPLLGAKKVNGVTGGLQRVISNAGAVLPGAADGSSRDSWSWSSSSNHSGNETTAPTFSKDRKVSREVAAAPKLPKTGHAYVAEPPLQLPQSQSQSQSQPEEGIGPTTLPLSELYDLYNEEDADEGFEVMLDGSAEALPAADEPPLTVMEPVAKSPHQQQQLPTHSCSQKQQQGENTLDQRQQEQWQQEQQLHEQQEQQHHSERQPSREASPSERYGGTEAQNLLQQGQQQQQMTGQRTCKVCSMDLTALHYLQAVAHVKSCMVGRRAPRGARMPPTTGQQGQLQQQQQPPRHEMSAPAQPPLPPATTPHEMDIQEWLQARLLNGMLCAWKLTCCMNVICVFNSLEPTCLFSPCTHTGPDYYTFSGPGPGGLCTHVPGAGGVVTPKAFMGSWCWAQAVGWMEMAGIPPIPACPHSLEQEVDCTVVHMISAEELQVELGMADRLHQRRFLEAAAHLAPAPAPRAGLGASSQRPAAPKKQAQLSFGRQQQRQQQQAQQQYDPGDASTERAVAGGDAAEDKQRCQELTLLGQLFSSPTPHARPTAKDGGEQGPAAHVPQLRTPKLPPSRVQAAHGTPSASLWAAAATCTEVAPRVEERLALRRAADPAAAAARAAPLARGGSALPAGEESRATKRVKLEALRQELATHEQTVADLRAMIRQLEVELSGGEQECGGGGNSARSQV